MENDRFLNILEQLEKHTREGKNHEVVSQLRLLLSQQIPRDLVVSFADIAYRTNQFIIALKFLKPILHPKIPLLQPATLKENTIYATSLLHLGAVEEAEQLLAKLDPSKDPEILLHRAFAYFAQWKYAASVPLLKKFIQAPGLAHYRSLVGKVNLAAAYVFSGQLKKAERFLVELRDLLEKEGHGLLLGNSLELTAQVYFLQKKYFQAEEYLIRAEQVLSATPGRYLFYVKKAHTLIEVMKSEGKDPVAINRLNKLRQEALTLKQWETLRDCDLFEALSTKNDYLIHKVLLGTPHAYYKKRVINLVAEKPKTPSIFHLNLLTGQDSELEKGFLFEVSQYQNKYEGLAKRPVLYQLFKILTLDFYKPVRLGFIFSRLYPHEKFDPLSSPHRIFNGVHYLNVWFKKNKIPMKIIVVSGEFHLKPLRKVVLSFTKSLQKLSKPQHDLQTLHKTVGCKVFTADKAANSLNVSKPTVLKLIHGGVSSKFIQKIGNGKSTLYRFSKIGKIA